MMHLGRKQDLSVIYWLKGVFAGMGVDIVDGYTDSDMVVPCISVEWERIDTYQLELGSKKRPHIRSWYLDIYAKNKSQRDEIVFKLLDELESKIDVYDYDQGFPPLVTPTKIGILDIIILKAKNIQVIQELAERMHYRASISFVTQSETIGGI